MLTTTVFLFLFLPLPSQVISIPRWTCGGTLTNEKGNITSPNFPKKFPTPINCEWHIDSQPYYYRSITSGTANLQSAKPSIKIYLTQLYVLDGLRIIEYDNKDAYEYHVKGVTVFELNEDDVTSNRTYIVVQKEYVVVEFNLDHIDSTNLRVLDGLLDVYGFNITYEISSGPARGNRCSMKLCGFTGYCYDDFTHFKCDCFPGFQGRRCSEGPKSKCFVNGQPVCENGAECLHTGHTAFICDCKPGYQGNFCEHRTSTATTLSSTGCINNPNCLISCKFNGTMENVCRCNQNGRSNKYLQAINESIGYSSRIFVQSKLNEADLRETLKLNMLETFKGNITKLEDIEIFLTSMPNNEMDVTFRFYASKTLDEVIRSTIRKWGRFQYLQPNKNYNLTEKDILIKTEPYLYLENIAIDKTMPISQGEEFVLSCTARGSKFMIFRWFMDGLLINLTRANTNKWEQLIPKDRTNSDHYTALLVVRVSSRYDSGRFTCHVEDYGIQQCRSLHVTMNYQPQIKLEPASLTVNKAESFTIKCISLAKYGEKYKFSWTKDKSLLPIRTENEHYEVLYPGGSILQVSGLNKTTWYSCLAHLDKLSTESAILVHVIDKQLVKPCPPEHFDGFAWPETAPGGECKQECPDEYFGIVTRSCIMMENGEPKWLLPDYSNCTQLQLMESLSDFHYLERGYAKTTPLQTLIRIFNYVENEGRKLLRGEGRAILHLVERVSAFNNASEGYSNHRDVTDVMLEIFDRVLAQNVSLNKEQQVVTLQKLAYNQLLILSSHLNQPYRKILENLQVFIDIDANYLNPSRIIRIDYKNLFEFLTKKSVIRLNHSDDREMKYEIFTGITSIWHKYRDYKNNHKSKTKISALFHYHMDTTITGPFQGVIKCVLAKYAASDYVWNAYKCQTAYENATHILCECSEEGTMTILLIDDVNSKRMDYIAVVHEDIVLVGCAICFGTCTFSGILLILSWCRHKSSMTFLKAQCVLSVSFGMLLFLLGFSEVIPKTFYLNVLSCLLISYLMALSSQLSTLLIIYTDLIEMQQITSIKPTVIGIITGAPIIAVFANHLTHNIMDISLQHWWIVRDTLSFYMFVVCIAIVFVLYVILCCLVSKLLKNEKLRSDRVINYRSAMMTKSILIFIIIIISAGSSVACVNHSEEIIWQYIFAATSIFMGLVIMFCLVFKVQTFTKKYLLEKLYRRTANSDKHGKSRENHISHNKCDNNVLESQNSPEIEEYKTSPTQYSTSIGNSNILGNSNSLNSPDILGAKVFAELDLVASSLQSGSTFDNVSQTNSPKTQIASKSTNTSIINNIANIDEKIDKTLLNNSPKLLATDMNNIDSNSKLKHLKINKTDKCVTFCDQIEYDNSGENKTVQEQVCVETINNTTHLTNTEVNSMIKNEGNDIEINTNASDNGGTGPNLDEVLDGISNDLKYLLNDHQFVDPINTISC